MASNTWEVVTKSKKQRNFEKKIEEHAEKKRLAQTAPRLEEILSPHQLTHLLHKSNNEKEDKPQKKVSATNSNKSSKPKNKTNESKKKSPPRPQITAPPKPKNLETAFQKITVDELNGFMEQLRTTFPDNELYLLREVASFLNSNLPFETEPVFAGKSHMYPSNAISKQLKTALVDILQPLGETNLSYFFDTLMLRMTDELSKNKPVVGYKLLIQIIGQKWPIVCSNNLAKIAILRNSYQNRSNVGLSILWCVGQGGYTDVNVGVKVWQNLMLPVIEMKSYSRFVSSYIEKVLSLSKGYQKLLLNQPDFFAICKALKTKYSIPKECQQQLLTSSSYYLKKYIDSSTKHSNLFLNLFRDIEDPVKSQVEIDGCIGCLSQGDECYKIWKMNYKKNVLPTYLLLQRIYTQWDTIDLSKSPAFQDFLDTATQFNLELESAKKRDPALDDLLSLFENVADKTLQEKQKEKSAAKKSSCCSYWFLGILVLVVSIYAAIQYDTNVNGKGVFEASATGKMLKKAGLLHHAQHARIVILRSSARAYKWAEATLPDYWRPFRNLIIDLYKLSVNAICNLSKSLRNYSVSKWPAIAEYLEQYVPGLPKKLEDATVTTSVFVTDSVGRVTEFLKVNVFTGSALPENLQKVLNQTQTAVLNYLKDVDKKIDSWAKHK